MVPKRVITLTSFRRCVLKKICYKSLYIIVIMNIHKGVIAITLFHIDKVKNLNVITLLFEHIARISQ